MNARGALTLPAQAAAEQVGRGQGVKSREARSMVLDLLDAPVPVRRQVMAELPAGDWGQLMRESLRETGSMYGLWRDTPSGFVEDILGETIWSLQRDLLDAIVTHKRVACPAGFGVGKTHIAGRAVAWFVCVNPVGTALVVTTATRFRQVKNQLWPHIRKVHARAGLPGETDLTQWKMTDDYGTEVQVAYGFTAPAGDEAAMQGIHAPKLLLVVDEAGGIDRSVGAGTNNLLTGDARMLAIGNPPTDDPRSWFETLCEEGNDPDEATSTTIPIPTTASPAISGEKTPVCRDCPRGVPEHTIGDPVVGHMPNRDWMDRTIRERGADSAYVIAKVHAKFPTSTGNLVIPSSWVDTAIDSDDPAGEDVVFLTALGLPREHQQLLVRRGSWVRLGVDIAADGGDEFAIYRAVGDLIHQRHVSSGSVNSNAVDVAEKVLEEIIAAEQLAEALGSLAKVRVKVDTIGVGWGVVGMLQRWHGKRHRAVIVPVNVAESPEYDHSDALMKPWRKRDELWITGRLLLQPDPSTGQNMLRLGALDHKAKVQLSLPQIGDNAAGFAVVESKRSLRSRGLSSPDRAEAALLSVYEPTPVTQRKRRGIIGGG